MTKETYEIKLLSEDGCYSFRTQLKVKPANTRKNLVKSVNTRSEYQKLWHSKSWSKVWIFVKFIKVMIF